MDPSNKESAPQLQEGETTGAICVEDSDSAVPTVATSEEATVNSTSNTEKAPFRSSHASRQTIEDLESKAKHGQKGETISRASSISTQPGAVAMYQTEPERNDVNSTEPPSIVLGEMNCCPAAGATADTDTVPIPMIHAQLAADTRTPLTIQAHLAEDPVIVAIPQAHPVTPPPEALHVQFDEEAPPPPGPTPAPADDFSYEEPTKLGKFWTQHGKPLLRFQILLLIAGLIAGIIIPRIHKDQRQEEMEDKLEWLGGILGEDFQNALSAPTPSPSTQSVYHCYESTLQIALAQAEDPSKHQYTICPNTRIPIGHLSDDDQVEGGDYPLTVLADNVEIRCGWDGERDNHCFLDGGFLQVLLQPSLPDELSAASVNRTDNVVFRGITFTGDLTDSHANIGGVSVVANNPGANVTFVDCLWENMTAPRGLVQIGDHYDATTFGPTADVTFEDCTFSNITYDGPLIGAFGQGVTLRRSRFQDLSLPAEPQSCQVHDSMDWCHGLLYCFDRSECEVEDICVEGLEYAGAAAIATASFQTNLTVSGSTQGLGLTLHKSVVSTSSNATCSTGMAQFTDSEYQEAECLIESANWTTTNSCLL